MTTAAGRDATKPPAIKVPGLPVWERRDRVTIEPVGLVKLATVLERFGRAMFGPRWTGGELAVSELPEGVPRRVSRAPPPPRASKEVVDLHAAAIAADDAWGKAYAARAREINASNRVAVERQVAVLLAVQRALARAKLWAYCDQPSGDLAAISANWWRTPAAEAAVRIGGFEDGAAISWLFVSEPELLVATSRLEGARQDATTETSNSAAADRFVSTGAAELRAEAALRQIVAEAGEDVKALPKSGRWRELACETFQISGEGAKRVWAKVAGEHPQLSSFRKPKTRRLY